MRGRKQLHTSNLLMRAHVRALRIPYSYYRTHNTAENLLVERLDEAGISTMNANECPPRKSRTIRHRQTQLPRWLSQSVHSLTARTVTIGA